MKEPRRLRGDASSDLERRLLGAGRARAPREARQRALVAATSALGTSMAATCAAAAGGAASGGAAGGGATAGGAAASTIAKTGSAAMLKWLSVVGLAGIGAATAAVSMQQDHPATAPPATPAQRDESAALVVPMKEAVRPPAMEPAGGEAAPIASQGASATAVEAPPPSPRRADAPGTMAPPTPSASSGSTLSAELAMLDEARAVTGAGEPARALSILDAYTERFPRGSMAAEATVLRIEALVRAGDRAAAQRSADAFLTSHPTSAYAERIRSLLGESNP